MVSLFARVLNLQPHIFFRPGRSGYVKIMASPFFRDSAGAGRFTNVQPPPDLSQRDVIGELEDVGSSAPSNSSQVNQ